ncbi:DUF2786 domain-containing protein [Amycolatopsis cihanbeyliensis]|uniref:Uncharacterized protein DUF2786 n=1 Tax=Amycolatopsis cihanbeyliensis TaxID=1128664 RepID=A0A542CTH5_AMYCI|nr:DUF2786 domain-containing protein [Amycolatopsis cihanbeyliensis]TQI94137.1 uncharacterized protein DUF2786 [Amycolatopsis cihanbeyliensis]
MSRRNREKRNAKAKQRARRRRGPTPPRDDYGSYDDGYCDCPRCTGAEPSTPSEMVATTLLAAANGHLHGDASAPAECAGELTSARSGVRTAELGAGVGLAFGWVLGGLWERGWLPVDVWQVTRRRLDARAAGLVIDAIAAEHAQYAPAGVHERWANQLGELEADRWWDESRPYLEQWAERRGLGIEQVVVTAITLLGLLVSLPELPRILPLPGTATRHGAVAGVDQKVLSRVRALLAKAESTDYPEEAEALSAKAQELMNRHAFERALLDAETYQPQVATSRRVWLDSPYADAKAQLVHVIAEANRSRAVHHDKIGFVSLVGEEMDLEIVELLVTSLLVQATKAMVAEGSQKTRTGGSRTRSFRQSFLIAYAVRIGERLTSEEAAAQDLAEDPRLLPVLADRGEAVDAAVGEMFGGFLYEKKAGSARDGAGWAAGRAAADLASLELDRGAVTS